MAYMLCGPLPTLTSPAGFVHPELIRALAVVKQAAAERNMQQGQPDSTIGSAIYQAAAEVAEDRLTGYAIN